MFACLSATASVSERFDVSAEGQKKRVIHLFLLTVTWKVTVGVSFYLLSSGLLIKKIKIKMMGSDNDRFFFCPIHTPYLHVGCVYLLYQPRHNKRQQKEMCFILDRTMNESSYSKITVF